MMTPHEASPKSIDACVELWLQAIAERDGTAPVEGTHERIRGKFDFAVLRFAAVGDDADPDGFALTTADGVLQLLAVAPRAAGRGIGRLLLVDAIDAARAAGVAVVTLEVRIGNRRAIALYESVGMLPDGDPKPHPLGGQPISTYRLQLV